MAEPKEEFPLVVERLVETATGIARDVLAPMAEQVDRNRIWPRHSFDALASAGLMGLHVPESLGGSGQGLLALAAMTEVLAQGCSSSAICYGMHCVGTAVIAAKPNDHQRETYLREIAAGRHITTLSVSEPGTGVHFYLPRTALTEQDDSFIVRGTKHFVTNGSYADSYVVSTRAASAREGEFSCVIIDASLPGIEWKGEWDGMGMRGNSSILMDLKDVRIPTSNLLGEQGDQIWYVFEVVAPYFLVAMAGTYLGITTAAVNYTLQHLRSRAHEHSGESLAEVDTLQHRVGKLWSRLESARQLLYHAARLGDAGHPDALPAILSCKAEISDAGVEIVNEAMTICGGIAYRENGPLARLLRDVRASHVMAPTTDVLRLWTGRALLGQPIL